jgi:hypothetical protein
VPRPRIDMRKIREVLRLALGEELSRRQVSAVSGVPLTRRYRNPLANATPPGGTMADHLKTLVLVFPAGADARTGPRCETK